MIILLSWVCSVCSDIFVPVYRNVTIVFSLISGVEIQCIGHFKLLFCLLRLDDCAKLQQFALDVSICTV